MSSGCDGIHIYLTSLHILNLNLFTNWIFYIEEAIGWVWVYLDFTDQIGFVSTNHAATKRIHTAVFIYLDQ